MSIFFGLLYLKPTGWFLFVSLRRHEIFEQNGAWLRFALRGFQTATQIANQLDPLGDCRWLLGGGIWDVTVVDLGECYGMPLACLYLYLLGCIHIQLCCIYIYKYLYTYILNLIIWFVIFHILKRTWRILINIWYIDTTATADVQIPNQLVGWILLSVSVAAPQVAYYWTLFWWPLNGINSCS